MLTRFTQQSIISRNITQRRKIQNQRKSIRRDINYMVAVDGSPQSIEAIKECSAVAKPEDKIFLIHVVEPLSMYLGNTRTWQLAAFSEPNVELIKENEEKMVASLKSDLTDKIPDFPERYEFMFKEGPPPYTICEAVHQNDIKMLFVGDRGLGGVKRVLLGSLANYCVHYAPCSVVIIKDKERAESDFLKISD
eukprot:TRINITY_DN11938_c0_g1_i1.p1 TRINITY_DN11938_c0_g1~~TRINITY_DN11938_c0_g1_i1.p1  ORF type:complete len:205 (+),score=39.80 TRINITY_DN11938_c0_g1_i1:39-617(+)